MISASLRVTDIASAPRAAGYRGHSKGDGGRLEIAHANRLMPMFAVLGPILLPGSLYFGMTISPHLYVPLAAAGVALTHGAFYMLRMRFRLVATAEEIRVFSRSPVHLVTSSVRHVDYAMRTYVRTEGERRAESFHEVHARLADGRTVTLLQLDEREDALHITRRLCDRLAEWNA